jgi:hypothetical protein
MRCVGFRLLGEGAGGEGLGGVVATLVGTVIEAGASVRTSRRKRCDDWGFAMGRNVSRQANALATARERRRRLDRARDEQDRRVEAATADVLVGLAARDQALVALAEQAGAVADALRVLMGLDVSAERAAGLVDLDVAEIRRLAKLGAQRAAAQMAKPLPVKGDGAAQGAE